MNRQILSVMLFGFLLQTFTLASSEDLSGKYKVKGECAYRAENGEYKNCIAWNELSLEKEREPNKYKFSLTTNTFATTQSGCFLEGSLQYEKVNGQELLRASELQNNCHFDLEITPKKFILKVPEADYFACQKSCGWNSSLYSDPFPRKRSIK
jgi:hypothetical protein